MRNLSVREEGLVGAADGSGCIIATGTVGISLVLGFAGPADWLMLGLGVAAMMTDCRA